MGAMSESAQAETVGREDAGEKRLGFLLFSLLAILVGVVSGIGAAAFRALIAFIHNLMYYGAASFDYDATIFTAGASWGAGVILVPVLGGLGVTYLVKRFAPEVEGSGVPEVMDAIYYRTGVIRPIVAAAKTLASALSIGSGAAVGREGPIIQIGASLGSTIGQVLKIAAWQRMTLVAAGAGAGIAATFNTPLAGVIFAIEVIMPEVSARTFLPVALATGTATFIGNIFLGPQPAFEVPNLLPMGGALSSSVSLVTLVLYGVLGAVSGLVAAAFIHALTASERVFGRLHNRYLRHALGMLVIGVTIYLMFQYFGRYYVDGVGYDTIQALLLGELGGIYLLGFLCLAKLAATAVSLGSGASGGIFSPSLFIGATLGGAFGAAVNAIHPVADVNVASFAMVGMAAMLGGATGAALTAITTIFEMTRDYAIVMPMILAVALSIGVRRLLSQENIFTSKLLGRRHFIPKALHANMFLVRQASEIMDRDVLVLPDNVEFSAFLRHPDYGSAMRHVVVTRGGAITGAFRVNTALRRGMEESYSGVTLGELAQDPLVIVREDDVAFDVIQRMWRRRARMAVVVAGHGIPGARDVVGVISKEHIADSVEESTRPYAS